MKYKVYGCRVNKYYLNKRHNYLISKNLDHGKKYLVATCVVTDRAKSKWIKDIKKHIKDGYEILLTGCGVFEKGNLFDENIFFDIYKDLSDFKKSIKLLGEEAPDFFQTKQNNIYTKKYIIIQNGCDNKCTYCMSVLKRGPSRDTTIQTITNEINEFENIGGNEIVLTGINLAAWGTKDSNNYKESKFSLLIENILNKTKIKRIRLSSLGPEFLDDKFFELITNKRIMPHFHFSIQSFSDSILKKMGRNYNKTVLENKIEKIKKIKRENEISLGADLIVGFPGEKNEDFLETLNGVIKYGINKLHVFPFSPHIKYETVIASKYKQQIEYKIKKEREKMLISEGEKIRKEFIKNNYNKTFEVLLEENKKGVWFGRTPNYIQINIEGNDYKKGDIINLILNENNCNNKEILG